MAEFHLLTKLAEDLQLNAQEYDPCRFGYPCLGGVIPVTVPYLEKVQLYEHNPSGEGVNGTFRTELRVYRIWRSVLVDNEHGWLDFFATTRDLRYAAGNLSPLDPIGSLFGFIRKYREFIPFEYQISTLSDFVFSFHIAIAAMNLVLGEPQLRVLFQEYLTLDVPGLTGQELNPEVPMDLMRRMEVVDPTILNLGNNPSTRSLAELEALAHLERRSVNCIVINGLCAYQSDLAATIQSSWQALKPRGLLLIGPQAGANFGGYRVFRKEDYGFKSVTNYINLDEGRTRANTLL